MSCYAHVIFTLIILPAFLFPSFFAGVILGDTDPLLHKSKMMLFGGFSIKNGGNLKSLKKCHSLGHHHFETIPGVFLPSLFRSCEPSPWDPSFMDTSKYGSPSASAKLWASSCEIWRLRSRSLLLPISTLVGKLNKLILKKINKCIIYIYMYIYIYVCVCVAMYIYIYNNITNWDSMRRERERERIAISILT